MRQFSGQEFRKAYWELSESARRPVMSPITHRWVTLTVETYSLKEGYLMPSLQFLLVGLIGLNEFMDNLEEAGADKSAIVAIAREVDANFSIPDPHL